MSKRRQVLSTFLQAKMECDDLAEEGCHGMWEMSVNKENHGDIRIERLMALLSKVESPNVAVSVRECGECGDCCVLRFEVVGALDVRAVLVWLLRSGRVSSQGHLKLTLQGREGCALVNHHKQLSFLWVLLFGQPSTQHSTDPSSPTSSPTPHQPPLPALPPPPHPLFPAACVQVSTMAAAAVWGLATSAGCRRNLSEVDAIPIIVNSIKRTLKMAVFPDPEPGDKPPSGIVTETQRATLQVGAGRRREGGRSGRLGGAVGSGLGEMVVVAGCEGQ